MPNLMQTTKLLRTGAHRIFAPIRKPRLLATAFAAVVLLCSAGRANAQATVGTATRSADLQVGVTYSGAKPDYSRDNFYGFGGYVTLDFTHHYGVEVNIRQVSTTANNKLYERTYEIGGRYVRHYGRFGPYARINVGRGVFNFPNDTANLAYNLVSGGAGVDVNIIPSINVRGDFEVQKWLSFPPNGLQPMVATVGVAYHFH